MPTNQRKVTLTGRDSQYFVTRSDAGIIMGADEWTSNQDECRVQLHEERGRRAEWEDWHPPQNLNQRWHAAITGGLPLRWYIVAVFYWTIVILLGPYPWNILLMLLALPAMDFPRRDQTARCWPGCPVNTGHHDER